MSTNTYPRRVLAVDVETTGLNSQFDYITQIGAVIMEDGNIIGDPFYSRIAPNLAKAKLSLEAIAVQSGDLTTEEGFDAAVALMKAWTTSPSAKDVALEFATWMGDDSPPLLAFNAAFDTGFLSQWHFQQKAAFRSAYFSPITVDPMQLAKRIYPGGKSYNLDAVLVLCGLPPRPKAHDALQDAILAAQCYFILLERFNGGGC